LAAAQNAGARYRLIFNGNKNPDMSAQLKEELRRIGAEVFETFYEKTLVPWNL